MSKNVSHQEHILGCIYSNGSRKSLPGHSKSLRRPFLAHGYRVGLPWCRATMYEKFTEIPLYPGAISLGQHKLLGVKKAKAMADRKKSPENTCFVPLQAKNPKMRTSPPRADRGTEWPGMGTGLPCLSNRPMRGPIITHPTSAQTAEAKKND